MDFKDCSTVPLDLHDPDAKRAHVIETCNFVDAGTSIVLDAQVHAEFHAETAFQAIVAFLRRYGRPAMLTFDRDPRCVGGAAARDFPSALCQFLYCVGVQPNVLPPATLSWTLTSRGTTGPTKKNACWSIVPAPSKRFARSPRTLCSTTTTSARIKGAVVAISAHPILPSLPPLPTVVDPDAWLQGVHGQTYARRVKAGGCVQVDGISYYVKQALAGHMVTLWVNATQQCFEVMHHDTIIKQVPIKGLQGMRMPLDDYIALMQERARSEERQRLMEQRRRYLQAR